MMGIVSHEGFLQLVVILTFTSMITLALHQIPECGISRKANCLFNVNTTGICTCRMTIDNLEKNCNLSEPMKLKTLDEYSSTSLVKSYNEVIPYKLVNSKTVEIYVEVIHAGLYFLHCISPYDGHWNRLIPVPHISAGYSALDVVNFRCISYNLEELVCHWDLLDNPARGNEKYIPYLYPNNVECGWGSRGCFYDSRSDVRCCYWNVTSGFQPFLSRQRLIFHIKDTFTGNITHFSHSVETLAIVLPNPVNNLTVELTNEDLAIMVNWSNPESLVNSSTHFIYRVDYRMHSADCNNINNNKNNCEWIPGSNGHCSNVRCNDLLKKMFYPGQEYEIQVRIRSDNAAKKGLEKDYLWSDSVSNNVSIPPQRPWLSPVVTPGMYQVTDNPYNKEQRDATIAWQPLHFSQFNGPSFHYVIRIIDFSGNRVNELFVPSVNSFLTVTNLSKIDNYTFEITSANGIGESEEPSVLHLPVSSSDLLNMVPVLPAVIYHPQSDVYHFRWQRVADYSNYTIYLCVPEERSRKDNRQQPCQGMLYWLCVYGTTSVKVKLNDFYALENKHMPKIDTAKGEELSTTTIRNINTSMEKNNETHIRYGPLYRFAISSQTDAFLSSGLQWSCCSFPEFFKESLPGQPQIKEEFSEVSSHSILIRFEIQCSDWASIVEGVLVEYCLGEYEMVTDCNERRYLKAPMNTSAIDCLNSVFLSQLISNVQYSAWITLLSQGGYSVKSRSVIFTTGTSSAEAALVTWEIILLALGCLASVIAIVVIGRMSVRKVILIKKEFEIQPDVPAALINNLGNLKERSLKENLSISTSPQNHIYDLAHVINAGKKSSSYLDDQKLRKSESGGINFNILNTSNESYFKAGNQRPDQTAKEETSSFLDVRSAKREQSEDETSTEEKSSLIEFQDIKEDILDDYRDDYEPHDVNGQYSNILHSKNVRRYQAYVTLQEECFDGIITSKSFQLQQCSLSPLSCEEDCVKKVCSATSKGYVSILDIPSTQIELCYGSPPLENVKESISLSINSHVTIDDSNRFIKTKTKPVTGVDAPPKTG